MTVADFAVVVAGTVGGSRRCCGSRWALDLLYDMVFVFVGRGGFHLCCPCWSVLVLFVVDDIMFTRGGRRGGRRFWWYDREWV